jgi:hypothetical protein
MRSTISIRRLRSPSPTWHCILTASRPEVIEFSGLSTGELSHKLWANANREKIEKFHAACGLTYHRDSSMLNPRPDRGTVEAIVDAIDEDGDGELSVEEVQMLFSKLTGIPVEDIPSDDPEVGSLPPNQG